MIPSSAIELLQELVRIPSVNPAGTPGTEHVGEERCARYVEVFLRGIGAEAELRPVLEGRPNVVGRFPSDQAGKPRLLFAPHTDTVSVAGMTIEPFGGELREGRIWGRGASDTKGSMTAMLWALKLERERLAALPYEIWFAGLAGEEAGQQGARKLAGEEEFAFVIAGEPTGMDVVHAHKGCTHLYLTTRGRAVHAANPGLGENAIYKMAPVIELLRGEISQLLGEFRDELLGGSTLSVGVIEGGSKVNIVPDRCTLIADIRTVPGQEMDALVPRMRERLERVAPGLELEVKHSLPLYTDPAHPLIRALEAGGAKCVGAPWFCDAAIFAARGTPAIALGPGSIAQAHTEDEWLRVEDLELGIERIRGFLRGLGN
jgi:acetylornithine deacetylase/succinyl-diaminopimelate desuccinylase-like protein